MNEDADISLASAHHPEGKLLNVPTQRAMLSRWGNKILGMGFDKKYDTVTCVVRGFKRKVITSLELVNDGKELHLEIIQKSELMGYHIIEVPATLEWRDKKRGLTKPKRLLPEIALFKMRKTVVSHLVFNFVTNPGLMLLIPILSLISIITATSLMLFLSLLSKLSSEETLFLALRQTFIDGQLSLAILFFTLITLMIFMMFYFLSYQNKKYFDEVYTLIMRVHSKVKSIEEDNK